MILANLCLLIEKRVEQCEPYHLGFTPARDRTEQPGLAFAEIVILLLPQRPRLVIHLNAGLSALPCELSSLRKLACNGPQLRPSAAMWQLTRTPRAAPERPVTKPVRQFGVI